MNGISNGVQLGIGGQSRFQTIQRRPDGRVYLHIPAAEQPEGIFKPEAREVVEALAVRLKSPLVVVGVEPGATFPSHHLPAGRPALALVDGTSDNSLCRLADYSDARGIVRWAHALLLPVSQPGDGRYIAAVRTASRSGRAILLECSTEQLAEWLALWREVKGAAAMPALQTNAWGNERPA